MPRRGKYPGLDALMDKQAGEQAKPEKKKRIKKRSRFPDSELLVTKGIRAGHKLGKKMYRAGKKRLTKKPFGEGKGTIGGVIEHREDKKKRFEEVNK